MAAGVRLDILEMIHLAGSGHPGGSLSAVEILVDLYFRQMRIRPAEPSWDGRDRFILSKGHAAPALYSVLARRGFFRPDELSTLRKPGSRLQGHPDMHLLPGLDASTGSLGQGFATAVGLARGLRLRHSPARVFCLLGDGELQEGMVWEAAAGAAHARLANIVAIVDCNGVQLDGTVEDIKKQKPVRERWLAWGWHPIDVDGHSFGDLESAFLEAAAAGIPAVLCARTVKGRGVSFMEGSCLWHGRCPDDSELAAACEEIRRACPS
jgi:transketolase